MTVAMAARQLWLDQQVDLLRQEMDSFGLEIPTEVLTRVLRDRVTGIASQLRVTEQSARRYVTPDVLAEIARNTAAEIADEQPGAQLLEVPRVVPVTMAQLGQVFAALAEAGRVLTVNDKDGDECLQLVSLVAQVVSDHDGTTGQPVMLPPGALTRAARQLLRAARTLRDGGSPPGPLSPAETAAFIGTLERDAESFRAHARRYLPTSD